MNKRLFLGLIPLAACTLALAGCDDGYSDAVHYSVRTDPVLVKQLADELVIPDPPGQFPLLQAKDILDVRNPLFKVNEQSKEKDKKDLFEAKVFKDPTRIASADRAKIEKTLDSLYGTPANPKVDKLEKEAIDLLKLSTEQLAKGSRHYRVHCLHCHGVTGDGRGPTARWVNPHPRDYRQSAFKFQSVDKIIEWRGFVPPHRDDLTRVLEVGIEGTAMPSFVVLPTEERDALVSYVIHLSMRGRVEFDLIKDYFDLNTKGELAFSGDGSIEDLIPKLHEATAEQWVTAQDPKKQIQPPPYPYDPADMKQLEASVKRGYDYFMGKFAGAPKDTCTTCHKDFGRQSLFRYDEWGTFAKPANLTQGVYRGGRRPIDIYRRIHSGISPSGMVSFGNVLKDTSPKESKIWDVVNFVQALGNPAMRKRLDINID